MPNAFDYAVSLRELEQSFFSSRSVFAANRIYGAKPRSRFYDAENRLASCETTAAAVAAGVPKQRLEFAYDYMGRRIQKVVKAWNTTTSTYQVSSDTRFLYDGWNLVAEFNALASNAVVRTYVWGTDLSGSLQGAGGVGGLLAINSGSATYFPTFDGSGNITGLVNAASGTLEAEYEYDPFGVVIKAVGTAANAQPFGFSTRYTDQETGIVVYPGRNYMPSTGRWMSRDPSEEQGGSNLYGFCLNDGINYIDGNGLEPSNITKGFWYNLIKWKGDINDPLADAFLKHWIWGNGEEYRLSDSEFLTHVWGYEMYRVNKNFNRSDLKDRRDTLKMDPTFEKDLQSKCKGGNSFSGTYYIPDYALTSRTLGDILFIVNVEVKCTCNEIGKPGYEAKGTIRIQDAWDFNPMNRLQTDESAVGQMRKLHEKTGIGHDFPITSRPYSIKENWSGFAADTPYLERNW